MLNHETENQNEERKLNVDATSIWRIPDGLKDSNCLSKPFKMLFFRSKPTKTPTHYHILNKELLTFWENLHLIFSSCCHDDLREFCPAKDAIRICNAVYKKGFRVIRHGHSKILWFFLWFLTKSKQDFTTADGITSRIKSNTNMPPSCFLFIHMHRHVFPAEFYQIKYNF